MLSSLLGVFRIFSETWCCQASPVYWKNLTFKDIELLKTPNCLEIGVYGELRPPALNIDYLILLSLVLYFKILHEL
jgi:hypothetical protein